METLIIGSIALLLIAYLVVGMLVFSAVGVLFTYAIFRLQHLLPLNPQRLPALSPALAFNTAVSFTTNTNWQSYGGESTMSYFSQTESAAPQFSLSGQLCCHIDSAPSCCQSVGMTRTQIQLPDDTFARAKKLCEAREISLAELARRGIEYILSVYSTEQEAGQEWHPPTPRNLGWMGLSHAEIKAEAQLTQTEISLTRSNKA